MKVSILGMLLALLLCATLPAVADDAAIIDDSNNNIEIDTIKLDKGRKFYVVSEQNINNNNSEGYLVKFNSVSKEALTYDKTPSKISFYGLIEKTSEPRLAGKSATVKIKLQKIVVDRITYPVEAKIVKLENRSVRNGVLVGSPIYLGNLADVANTGVIHTPLKDPCDTVQHTCLIDVYKKPLVFLGASVLQAADIVLSPFIALSRRGKNIEIPPNTYFEIKLEKELHVLNI